MISKSIDQQPRGLTTKYPQAALAIVCIALLILTFNAATAAPPPGTVAGVVKDALQRPLGGAAVRLETQDGRTVARTTADDQGQFSFTGVAPGTYAVVAERSGFDAGTTIVTLTAQDGASADLTLASQQALDVKVAAKRLEEARLGIQPRIGASTYTITEQAVENQPRGENSTLTEVLLQAPGVTPDSAQSGQFHVRNEHGNVQYRINGVALPEGISLFGQALTPRLARSIDLIRGALPAQYGLRTAGVVDIETKSGAFERGGFVSMYGGSHSWLQPSAEARGSYGRFNYFLTGDYVENDIGIAPAQKQGPIHDRTHQDHGFGYLEYILDSTSKVSLVVGTFNGSFEIPTRPDQAPGLGLVVTGVRGADSRRLDAEQFEENHYGVLSYLKAEQDLTYQASVFTRYSTLRYRPDPHFGDLLFTGLSQRAYRENIATGLQVDGSYVLTPEHTLRGGIYFSPEQTQVRTKSDVLPTDDTGAATSDLPFRINDGSQKTGYTYSVYAQDAWRIVPSVTVNVGLRFDDVEAFTSEYQFSPRVNVVWTPTTSTTVFAGYARYFTPPPLASVSTTSATKFNFTTAASEVTRSDAVKAERADYFDAGVSQVIIPGLRVGFDAYYKNAVNLIDEGQFGAPILQTPFNYRVGHNWGIELSASYVSGGLSTYANLAIAEQEAKRIVSAQALFAQADLDYIAHHFIHTDHDQRFTASAGIAYLFPTKTRISVDMIAGSGLRQTKRFPNDATVPDYQQINLGLTQKFTLPAIGAMEARFDIINLFDGIYPIRSGTGVGVVSPQFGPPRSFFAGLKKEF
jgi:outer membrane receptor protein involved in Fe transport